MKNTGTGSLSATIRTKKMAKYTIMEMADRLRAIRSACDPSKNQFLWNSLTEFAEQLKQNAAENEALRSVLRDCVEQNLNCLYNHYGDNPEGCALPEYIRRAQDLLGTSALSNGERS